MKYLARSLKYFLYLTVVFVLIVTVLVMAGLASSDIDEMFRNGKDSIWQIALIIAGFSLVYPRFGYCSRRASAPGSFEDNRAALISFMADHRYVPETEEEGKVVFRSAFPLMRVMRMGEDRITVSSCLTGFEVEGLTREVVRIVSGLETRFSIP